jgi:hypothetical protein
MNPERLRGPDAALEIGRLAYGHLGSSDELSYAPSIPRAKEAIARARIAAQAQADEPLLVLYDGTWLGSGTRGFAVTERRFCFRSAFGAPRAITWEELRSSAVTVRGGLGIGRHTLRVRGDMIEDTALFLDEMGRRLATRESTLYRQAATLDLADDADGQADSVALSIWRHMGALGGARYHPFILPPRLARARAALGKHLPVGETPALVYEDSLRLAPQGFVITPERLAWYAGDTYDGPGGRGAFLWSSLDRSEIQAENSAVHVRGRALPWLKWMGAPDGSTDAMVTLFRELAEGAEQRRAGQRR